MVFCKGMTYKLIDELTIFDIFQHIAVILFKFFIAFLYTLYILMQLSFMDTKTVPSLARKKHLTLH